MKKSIHIFILFCLGFVIIPGCKVAQYRKSSLPKIDTYALKKNGVELGVKNLSKNDISDIFGKESRKKIRKNCCLHISVKNNSDSLLVLDPKNIEIPQINVEAIVKNFQICRLSRMGAGAILSPLITFPAGIALSYVTTWAVFFFTGTIFAIIPPVIILGAGITPPAIFVSRASKWHSYNCLIKKDIEEKTISKKITIYPQQQFDGLIFVKKIDLKNKRSFNLKLYNKENKSIEYIFSIKTDQL